MQQFINTHCHILNFDFVPDAFLRTRAPIREWMLRHRLTTWIAKTVVLFLKGKKYGRIDELLEMMKKDISKVSEELIREMREANIVLSTPLMMDLELASFSQKPEIPYRYQMLMISDIAAKYPGQIMPFVMFDPRRRSVSSLIKTALEDMGFLGVKMYPTLGYDPNPESFLNSEETNNELMKVYGFCEKNKIPITTHCSKAGAYTSELLRFKQLAEKFTSPESWKETLKKYPGLNINFAHFGGDSDFMELHNQSSWAHKIKEIMKRYKNVYADISYHDKALKKETSEAYFNILKDVLKDQIVRDRTIFGTDWMMTRHTYKEKEFTRSLEKIGKENQEKIAFQNPINFLFPGKKLPWRIKEFYRKKGITKLPEWMEKGLK